MNARHSLRYAPVAYDTVARTLRDVTGLAAVLDRQLLSPGVVDAQLLAATPVFESASGCAPGQSLRLLAARLALASAGRSGVEWDAARADMMRFGRGPELYRDQPGVRARLLRFYANHGMDEIYLLAALP